MYHKTQKSQYNYINGVYNVFKMKIVCDKIKSDFVMRNISNWSLSLSLTQGREPSPWWGRWQACLTDEGIVTLQEKSTCANLIG